MNKVWGEQMNSTENYYEILEVNEKASQEIISKVFKIHIKKNHPDLFQGEEKILAEEKIKKLNEAYEILHDEKKREEYDQMLNEEKEEIKFNLENQIKSLKEELVEKKELIKNIAIEMGVKLPENNLYNETEYNNQNFEIEYNDIEDSHVKGTVFKSYLHDLKEFLKKVVIIIIGFIVFCFGTWTITGVNILKDIIDKVIKK